MALIEVAPSMTWLLVSTSPVEVSTIPVPAAAPPWYPSVVTTSTRPGSTFDATWGVVMAGVGSAPAPARPRPGHPGRARCPRRGARQGVGRPRPPPRPFFVAAGAARLPGITRLYGPAPLPGAARLYGTAPLPGAARLYGAARPARAL